MMNSLRGNSVSSTQGDLPEFEQFLAQVGQGHMLRLMTHGDDTSHDAAPCPDDLREARRHAEPVHDRPGRSTWAVTVCGAAAVLALLVLWSPLWNVLAGKAEKKALAYVSSPFFSPESFHAVRPGMTPDKVRDLIGIPLARRRQPNSVDWIYTAPGETPQDRFLLCTVAFEDERVVATHETFCASRDGLATALPRRPLQRTGLLQLVGEDGIRHMLPVAPPTPWILISPGAPEDVSALDVPSARVHDDNAAAPDPGTDSHAVIALRRGWLQVPALSVYCAGAVYALPLCLPGTSRDALEADLDWLLPRLH